MSRGDFPRPPSGVCQLRPGPVGSHPGAQGLPRTRAEGHHHLYRVLRRRRELAGLEVIHESLNAVKPRRETGQLALQRVELLVKVSQSFGEGLDPSKGEYVQKCNYNI